jgi:hypothetical protein
MMMLFGKTIMMEDIDPDSTHNIISYYDCKGCGAWYEIYTDKKEKE